MPVDTVSSVPITALGEFGFCPLWLGWVPLSGCCVLVLVRGQHGPWWGLSHPALWLLRGMPCLGALTCSLHIHSLPPGANEERVRTGREKGVGGRGEAVLGQRRKGLGTAWRPHDWSGATFWSWDGYFFVTVFPTNNNITYIPIVLKYLLSP